jgi:hypothetical protein
VSQVVKIARERGCSGLFDVREAQTGRFARARRRADFGRWCRLFIALSVLLALSLPVPDVAAGKNKRPKRRNGIATFDAGFIVPPGGAFTCLWWEVPFHDYECNPGLSVGTPTFGLTETSPENLRPPNALELGGRYPHEPDVDGWGGPFPLAHPDIAPEFSCRWVGAAPPMNQPENWRCSFTYNAHIHWFLVNDIVSVAYVPGSNATEQWFVPCDGVGPCPEEDPPPDTRITSGPRRAVAATEAALRFASSEPGSTFQCRLGSAAWAPCTAPVRLSNLRDGRQIFKVSAIDDRGKVDATPAQRRWRVDTTGPRIRILGTPVRVTRAGVAIVRLRCRRSERSGPCSGRLRLATRGGVRLSSERFKLSPGRPKRLRVKLGRRGRSLVADRGRVRVQAVVRARDRLGNVARSSRSVTLRAP